VRFFFDVETQIKEKSKQNQLSKAICFINWLHQPLQP